jgi:CTP:molybdopterin cytidylyltransferase MocA
MGGPKALIELGGEPLVRRALEVLRDGGCAPLVVVLGAAADEVRAVLPAGVTAVVEPGWAEGMGASLRAGLTALSRLYPPPEAALIHLVDLPGVTAAAVSRLATLSTPDVLARAAFAGLPAHPVLLGRSHWTSVSDYATGDAGARGYLAASGVVQLVECGDVADPDDIDTPDQLARLNRDSCG